jgi:uncharacterized protein (TIGR00661 family)
VKIFYGICGEGLGHSGRSLALIERLTALGHRVTIFSFADALQALTNSGYQPHRIEGLRFRLTSRGGVNLLGTAGNFIRYLGDRRESIDLIRQMATAERPDLFITDFEPLTAMAAQSLGIPCVSVDNQHRFCQPLGDYFPVHLRVYARLAGYFVRHWIRTPTQCIVAVFHECPPSPYYRRVNTMVRQRVARLQPTEDDHILLYSRGELARRMARIASAVPQRFIAYGLEGFSADNIESRPICYDRFAADLASCRGVVCTAGQQLIGEARFFGKPMLVVPLPNQHEQEINAWYVRRAGIGDYCSIEQLTRKRIEACFEKHDMSRRPANGVDEALELLRASGHIDRNGVGHQESADCTPTSPGLVTEMGISNG